MKKQVSIIVLFTIIISTVFAIGLVSAAPKFATETEAVNAAYACLNNQITNKTTLGFEEAIFTSLAIGFNNVSNTTINNEKNPSESCWPGTSCTLKRTAQVGLVYDFWGRNTSEIKKYLISKNITPSDINWFLEIDIEDQISASCTIRETYDGNPIATLSIGDDQKLSGNTGSCFTLDRGDYLLKISNSCMDKKFIISCNQAFLTTTLYKKSNSETYYVNADSHNAGPEGTTEESVSARCFGSGSTCDYEGSLWATLALQQFGMDVTPFIPYLIALSDDINNEKYLPSAFLYILTESSDSYAELVSQQKANKYWRYGNNSLFFDTSLAMLALQGSNAAELTRAKEYLWKEAQQSNGCWSSSVDFGEIRNTAFVLYAGWSQNGIGGSSGGSSGTGSGSGRITPIIIGNNTNNSLSACELAGYSCATSFGCLDSGGAIKSGYSCSGRLSCCTVKPIAQESCSIQGGKVCAVSQRCDGRSGAASDGSCCFGTCVNIQTQEDTNSCESFGYGLCKASCGSGEYESSYSCSTPGFSCCSASEEEIEESGSAWVWILLIMILILLVVFGIIYRENLKLWWFKMQNRKQPPRSPPSESATMMQRRPPQFGGFAQRAPAVGQRPGFIPRAPQPARTVKAPNARDKEMEDTLKKLKEMSE